MFTVHNQERTGQLRPQIFNLDFRVDRYTWAAIGGPKTATITAYGGESDLFGLTQQLRNGISIGYKGEEVWWGYIDAVDIAMPGIDLSVGLANMWNSIRVNYTDQGQSLYTTAGTVSASVTTYGTKEMVYSASDIDTLAAAEAMRDRLVEFYAYPRVEYKPKSIGNNDLYATITCAGWWNTLFWRYWENTGTADVPTGTLMGDIVTDTAELLSGYQLEKPSGISVLETRDGTQRAGDELSKLMIIGRENDQRYLCKVQPNLILFIYQEKLSDSATDYIYKNGKLSQNGYPIQSYKCPAGIWVRDASGILNSNPTLLLSTPGKFFIEESTYEVATNTWTPTPRGSYIPGGGEI